MVTYVIMLNHVIMFNYIIMLKYVTSSSSSKILFQQDSCIYKIIVGLHTGPA